MDVMAPPPPPPPAPSGGCLPPPPPPPLPGTAGASPIPSWREQQRAASNQEPSYSAPRRPVEMPAAADDFQAQQYANLPEKLLNTMTKEKKPFTYTPLLSGVDKGKLDLSQIKSPKMRRRLLANLQDHDNPNAQWNNGNDSAPGTPEMASASPMSDSNTHPLRRALSPDVAPPKFQPLPAMPPSADQLKARHFAPPPPPRRNVNELEQLEHPPSRPLVRTQTSLPSNDVLDAMDAIVRENGNMPIYQATSTPGMMNGMAADVPVVRREKNVYTPTYPRPFRPLSEYERSLDSQLDDLKSIVTQTPPRMPAHSSAQVVNIPVQHQATAPRSPSPAPPPPPRTYEEPIALGYQPMPQQQSNQAPSSDVPSMMNLGIEQTSPSSRSSAPSSSPCSSSFTPNHQPPQQLTQQIHQIQQPRSEPTQSRSFQILQKITDGIQDEIDKLSLIEKKYEQQLSETNNNNNGGPKQYEGIDASARGFVEASAPRAYHNTQASQQPPMRQADHPGPSPSPRPMQPNGAGRHHEKSHNNFYVPPPPPLRSLAELERMEANPRMANLQRPSTPQNGSSSSARPRDHFSPFSSSVPSSPAPSPFPSLGPAMLGRGRSWFTPISADFGAPLLPWNGSTLQRPASPAGSITGKPQGKVYEMVVGSTSFTDSTGETRSNNYKYSNCYDLDHGTDF